jgi:GNAT superfamily N-acetyltransferase
MIAIRPARPADIGAIYRFICELAAFEQAAGEVTSTPPLLHAGLFGPDPAVEALVAETPDSGEPVGFAMFYHTFSTWTGRRGIWLDDLYVAPEARGSGAGGALLQAVARIAVERDCARFEWWVLDWNEPAIGFYRSRGAVAQDEWTVQRVSGDALLALAGLSLAGQERPAAL